MITDDETIQRLGQAREKARAAMFEYMVMYYTELEHLDDEDSASSAMAAGESTAEAAILDFDDWVIDG